MRTKLTSREEDFKSALLENINAYPMDWTDGVDQEVGVDVSSALTSWVVNEYENDILSNKVALETWFEYAISVVCNRFDNLNYDTVEQHVRNMTNNYEEL